jgi:hypothetical protein
MKKNLLLTILSFLSTWICYGQLSAVDYYSKDFAKFKGTKTYAVRTGDPVFDKELESAMKESWKITSYDFLDSKELEKKISDPSVSFIVLLTIGDQNPYGQNYHYLSLINGGRKKLNSYGYDDLLAYAPINHFGGELENVECGYRVRNMLESMVLAMDVVQKNDIKGNSKKIADKLREYYNQRASNISKRTLLVCEEEVGGDLKGHTKKKITKQEFGGIYPYKFEFVSKARLAQVIQERSKDYYYVQLCSTLNHSVFVFDPSNGEVEYFDFKIMGLTLKDSDVEDLVKTMKGK